MSLIVAFLILVAFVIPIEHLAFGRHPYFADREMARRAIGIGTVMALALFPVALGGLDFLTWAALLAGFVLAGAVLGIMIWLEERKERAARVESVRSEIYEQIERWSNVADQVD